ncbi:MAG: cupredoxin family copper-binding protein [Gemmatimonadetes bacterium]|uniref:Cupredoxin family copper-binding protein n=1 Tax=Candidatus Kutchimonas denitrificans TaxID=3056748 RepID=A0AAE5CB62_9BACT|nr:cupredoxin family copper-binding protein [Gemmatimonadota bacterium]NIR74148.1 cupredoxin family copper-binding protein [Candidatus Kutchimonas denitrificans]NIS01330.1 cupredoxin family copper-binding protein [Gemmatimonadota bacterium]NIT67061.1 cupredoxin family copper-binding protein [Gemmatimonadota bacterium]NIU51721.1 amidase [Gemmatimonadota bacterium]
MSATFIRILNFVPLAAAIAFGTAELCRAQSTTAAAEEPVKTVEVEMRNFAFSADTIRIQPGTSVRWVNRDEVGHTSTADEGEWASPLLGPGESFTQRFDEAGTYTYHCTPHPFMRGVVIVEE